MNSNNSHKKRETKSLKPSYQDSELHDDTPANPKTSWTAESKDMNIDFNCTQ